MQKHIYWTIIIYLSTSLLASEPSAQETNIIVDNIVKQYRGLENDTIFKEQIKQRYKHLLNSSKTKKVKETLMDITDSSDQSLSKKRIFNEAMKITNTLNIKATNEINKYNSKKSFYEKKKPTIFYFYSESVPRVALERFFKNFNFVKKEI